MELVEGQQYLVVLTVTNQSTKTGVAVGATLGIGIAATADSVVLIPEQVSQEYFAAGETREFEYTLTVPADTGGLSGAIDAWVEAPTNSVLASASEPVTIAGIAPPPPPPGLANLYGIVIDAETGEGIWGALVALDGISTLTAGDGSYLIADLEPGLGNLTFTMEGYEVGYYPDVMLLEGNNEFNATLTPKPEMPPEPVTIDSFEIRCDFPGNIIYTMITLTNHTSETFIDETPTGAYGGLVTQLWARVYPSGAAIKPREWDSLGIGDVSPGTHIYIWTFHGKPTVLGPFFETYGIAEGVLGHAEVFFNSMDERPTPVEVFYSTHQMFEGIFSSAWQEWIESDWSAPSPPPVKSKVGVEISSIAGNALNPDMVLKAPRRSVKLITTKDSNPQAIRARMTDAGAGIGIDLNTSHIVIVPEALNVDEEVDVATCQQYNVRIDKGPISSTIFKDKGSVGLSFVKRRSDIASIEEMENLLQLSVSDVCLELGINPNSITLPSNDVFINERKVAGIEVQPNETIYGGAPLSVYTGRLFCNVDIEPELAAAVLRGKLDSSKVTSISTELGKLVSKDTFRRLLTRSLARRFNLKIR